MYMCSIPLCNGAVTAGKFDGSSIDRLHISCTRYCMSGFASNSMTKNSVEVMSRKGPQGEP
jgi:hypothetical protein